MVKPLLVLNVVGLTERLLPHAPTLYALAQEGRVRSIEGVVPAVTCSAQATMLTGTLPREHGIVGNGWYFRELAQVLFWRQSNQLVRGEKLWESARREKRDLRCAKMFWWFNMYSSADLSVTPRPEYPADGRKLPDVYAEPPALRSTLNAKLGTFPLFQFWGPGASIASSRWIAQSSLHVLETERPEIELVYLPHLDYPLQKLGPDHPSIPAEVAAVDREAAPLVEKARELGYAISVVSEYGIAPVTHGVHLNRVLRERGFLRVQETSHGELLDAGASRAFAVADHQVAHVYVRDPRDVPAIQSLLDDTEGVATVLDQAGKTRLGLDHARSGELVALAEPGCWFTYYYWLDDARAPDFARTVDIHRKPGYDPVELFLDPSLRMPKMKIAGTLLKKKLGFRYLLDVIPLDDTLVRGSHGIDAEAPDAGPLWIGWPAIEPPERLTMLDLKELWLRTLFGA
ncbi:MAG: alkaline phosphatase family protein [Planctomycetes bacterium]|nr:alkaline phosphatase family protein [Planctomycetota bacterium]